MLDFDRIPVYRVDATLPEQVKPDACETAAKAHDYNEPAQR
jgi:hypothetical protein